MIKIEEDGFYLNAMGEIIKVEQIDDGIFEDENGCRYKKNGLFSDCSNPKYDIIAYIPKELHYNILKMIKDYHSA